MNRRVWTGVAAGVLAAAVLLTVGVGAYQAGRDDEVVTRTVEGVDGGEVVRVVDHGRDFFPGFILFPLLIIAVIVLLARGGRRHWGRPYGPGYGPGGPGWGPGAGYWGGPGRGPWGPGGCGDPEAGMREWHRRMHEEAGDEAAGPGAEPGEAGRPAGPGDPDDPAGGRAGPTPASPAP